MAVWKSDGGVNCQSATNKFDAGSAKFNNARPGLLGFGQGTKSTLKPKT